jgi:hypothetical protein
VIRSQLILEVLQLSLLQLRLLIVLISGPVIHSEMPLGAFPVPTHLALHLIHLEPQLLLPQFPPHSEMMLSPVSVQANQQQMMILSEHQLALLRRQRPSQRMRTFSQQQSIHSPQLLLQRAQDLIVSEMPLDLAILVLLEQQTHLPPALPKQTIRSHRNGIKCPNGIVDSLLQ